MIRILILSSMVVGACSRDVPMAPAALAAAQPPQVATCQCSPFEIPDDPTSGRCDLSGDLDGDCLCTASDNCPGTPNCDGIDTDGDGFGDACDIMPNTPNPEATLADHEARIDAIEAALLMARE